MENILYDKSSTIITDMENYSAIHGNWLFSYEIMNILKEKINNKICDKDISIVIAGSYGRFDACAESDLDFFILSNEANERKVENIREIILEIADTMNISAPRHGGIFSKSISISEMISQIGSASELPFSLSQRLLLLTEAKPIYNINLYNYILEKILNKYFEYIFVKPEKQFVVLLNDLIRYFRTICVSYQFDFENQPEKWTIRNIKLRHSRVILYGGLLFLILNSSKYKENKIDYLREKITLTPMEKLIHVYKDSNISHDDILTYYNIFLENFNKKEIRNALKVEYIDRYTNPYYKILKENSDYLQRDLTDFIFKQKELKNWDDRIFEYLMF